MTSLCVCVGTDAVKAGVRIYLATIVRLAPYAGACPAYGDFWVTGLNLPDSAVHHQIGTSDV